MRDTAGPAALPGLEVFPNAPQGWSPRGCQRVAEAERSDLAGL